MIDFSAANLEKFASTWVGNKNRYEGVSVPSKTLLPLNDVTQELLTTSSIQPFAKSQEFFYFTGTEDVEDNRVYNSIRKIFADPESLSQEAKVLTDLLYEASENPKTHGGEFFLSYFTDVLFNGEHPNAIGFWKIDQKDPFFRTERSAESFVVSTMEGIQTKKPQVAAIVFGFDEFGGYRLVAVDTITKKGERSFWKDDFLRVRELEDDYFQTKHTIALTSEFLKNKAPFKFGLDRLQVIELLNKAGNYFKDNDEYERDNFAETVFAGFPEEVAETYLAFHSLYAINYGLPLETMFNLNSVAVKKFFKVFSNNIKLDDNFILQVKGRPDLVEMGYDEEKDKKFYKVYFEDQD